MKCLAIFALLLAFAVPTMPGQQKASGQQDARKSQRDAKTADFPASPVTNNQATSYYEQPRDNKPQGWHKLVAWPEGITAWLLMLTLGAIIWQSSETRRSANAAKKAAKAALLSARSLINIERPWVVVTAKSYGHWRFQFEATNRGKSPAEIIAIGSDWQIVRGGHDGRTPRYKMRNAMYPRMVFPGDAPYHCGVCNVGDILAARPDGSKIISGEGLFMMYGRVLYYDLLNRQDPPHETRFCFYWSMIDPQTVDDRDTPPEYVGYT
jgi:hypothetical protein